MKSGRYIWSILTFWLGLAGSAAALPSYPWHCISGDKVFRFTFNSDQDGFYTRTLAFEHQRFNGPVTKIGESYQFANYDSVLDFLNFSADARKVRVRLFTAGKLERSFKMSCRPNVLEAGPGASGSFQEPWLNALQEKLDEASKVGQSTSLQFNHVTQLEDFNFDIVERQLSQQISNIGDWYEVELTAKQRGLVNQYLETKIPDVLKFIRQDPNVRVLRPIFARDWYFGDGNIGVVLQNRTELLTIVVRFDSDVVFNDPSLDHRY